MHKTLFSTLALLTATLLLFSCGKHSFDDVFDISSSSAESSSSSVESSSSSSVEGSSSSGGTSSPSGVVGPLLKTIWAQNFPFYNMLPVDGDRRATFTGCGTVAQAQIM
ncbi:MAG: C10 family peptidase, partial [Fibromonadaceae bacterium]|nr:C10 family peptidase [Fibromonadaceae bacterium]